MSTVDVNRATNEFLAEELSADAKAQAQAEQVAAALNPPPVPAQPAPEAAPTLKVNPKHVQKLCRALLTVTDRIIVMQAGKDYALTAEEKAEIAEAAVPVVEKYLPAALGWLVTTPEGVLLGTVALVYGGKLGLDVAGLMQPEAAAETATTAQEGAPS